MRAESGRGVLIFTDLDGTLLDHETYGYEPAMPALNMLKDKGVPLILASSKTATEVAPLRDELGFSGFEAIVENGAGILEPNKIDASGGSDYAGLIDFLDQCPKGLRTQFSGFSDWTAQEVAQKTGLSRDQAERAKDRWYSEPIEWHGEATGLAMLNAYLDSGGYKMQKGGRFFSISRGATKATQMHRITERYSKNGSPVTLALGDGENDVEMLAQADIGVIIPNPAHRGSGLCLASWRDRLSALRMPVHGDGTT